MRTFVLLMSLLTMTFWMVITPFHALPQDKPPTWEVYFSPKGSCTSAIVKGLSKAETSVLVQAYLFTSAEIGKALLDVHKRGVKVKVILDKSQRNSKYAPADFFANAGIPTLIDAAHSIAHNKVMVIDGEIVITGSFNFTKSAEENNAENLLVIHDRELAELYWKNWQDHARHSEVYAERKK